MKDICVIIAAKDARPTIARAVSSALRQPEVAEIIVVDDGSQDDTAEVAQAADDASGRLKVIRLPANVGPAAARNRAIAASRAPLICVLDADDWMMDGRFAKLMAAGEDWDFLADDLFMASAATPQTPDRRLLDLAADADLTLDAISFVLGNISSSKKLRSEYGYLKPLMRRTFLDSADLRYDETLRLGEDYILYASALISGARFRVVGACGYFAVQYAQSLSHRHGAAELGALAAADQRLIAAARTRMPGVVGPLQRHRRAIGYEFDYRLALDAKKRGDWTAVLATLLRSPPSAVYIAAHVVRAKLSKGA